jgi:predicted anti-sigma-YlaC factor YlaD
MNCYDAIDLMDVALEGHVPPTARVGFEEHLEECRPCRHYFDQLTLTVRALEQLPAERGGALGAERRAALRQAFRARTRPTDS